MEIKFNSSTIMDYNWQIVEEYLDIHKDGYHKDPDHDLDCVDRMYRYLQESTISEPTRDNEKEVFKRLKEFMKQDIIAQWKNTRKDKIECDFNEITTMNALLQVFNKYF